MKTSILLAGLCLAAPAYAFLGGVTNTPQLRSASVHMCDSAAARPGFSRRESLARFTSLAFLTASPFAVSATPVRAPLPSGPADPADKQKLLDSLEILEGLASKLKDPEGWKEAKAIITKAPFTPDTMELMFGKAAKNLPPNNLLGSDAGIWVGFAVRHLMLVHQIPAPPFQDSWRADPHPRLESFNPEP